MEVGWGLVEVGWGWVEVGWRWCLLDGMISVSVWRVQLGNKVCFWCGGLGCRGSVRVFHGEGV